MSHLVTPVTESTPLVPRVVDNAPGSTGKLLSLKVVCGNSISSSASLTDHQYSSLEERIVGSEPFLGGGTVGSEPFLEERTVGSEPFLEERTVGSESFLGGGTVGSEPFLEERIVGSEPFLGGRTVSSESLSLDKSSTEPPRIERTSRCAQEAIKAAVFNYVKGGVNHDFIAGSIYIFNDITWIVNGILKAVSPKGYSAPPFLEFIKAFSILTGISNMFEAVRYIKEAEKTQCVWSRLEGGVRAIRSLGEMASGITGTAVGIVSTFVSTFDVTMLNNTALATTFGSAIMLGGIAVYSGINAVKDFYLHAKLSACKTSQERNEFLQSFNVTSNNLKFLESVIGEKLATKVADGEDLSDDELKTLQSTLLYNGIKSFSLSLVSVISAAISILIDTGTGGALSMGLLIAKPVFSAILAGFDTHQAVRGINKAAEYDAKYETTMRRVVNFVAIAVSITLTVTLFALVNFSTCGGATIAVGAVALVLPLVMLAFQKWATPSKQESTQSERPHDPASSLREDVTLVPLLHPAN